MNIKYQVFVSSTYEDLKDERAKVIGVLLENNCIPVGMEQFPASNLSQWEYIKKMIDMSDYYILISAGKYGSIDDETGVSYTEKEFDYAMKQNIPILSFINKELEKLPLNKNEATEEKRDKLKQFHEKAKKKLVKFYTNVDNLATMVVSSLNKIISDCPRPGWIRNDSSHNIKCNLSVNQYDNEDNHLVNDVVADLLSTMSKNARTNIYNTLYILHKTIYEDIQWYEKPRINFIEYIVKDILIQPLKVNSYDEKNVFEGIYKIIMSASCDVILTIVEKIIKYMSINTDNSKNDYIFSACNKLNDIFQSENIEYKLIAEKLQLA